jgi:hypoxanthine phosphoribosyltransferase
VVEILNREDLMRKILGLLTLAARGGKSEGGLLTPEGGTVDHQKLCLLISRQEISSAVGRLAALIRSDYGNWCPFLLGVLKGSFVFLADLVREVDIPLTVDFIRARSYDGTTSTGAVVGSSLPEEGLSGRHVLLVEDIVDTGITASYLIHQLEAYGPASLKLCALLDKPSARVVPVRIDYLGFTVPDGFVVGYGLDLDQQYRYLPDVYILEEA